MIESSYAKIRAAHHHHKISIECTLSKVLTSEEYVQIAASISLDIDKPSRAVILKPRKILPTYRQILTCDFIFIVNANKCDSECLISRC